MKSIFAAAVAALLLGIPGSAQSVAELLQKGIYAQETAGDLDSAIRIFRQVASTASNNKSVAAQAQYQLVLCMLQRGDRAGAAKEVETLARNFPDQPELVANARKLLPGSSTVLPAPWGDGECSQLNIKRDGVATGENLYYSIDPPHVSPYSNARPPAPTHQWLRWELTTKKSQRSVQVTTDRINGQIIEPPPPIWQSNDVVGDPLVDAFAGPAIDIQQSVFAIRRLPLAVGYKTTLTTLPLSLANLSPKEVELAVTGIEPVEVTAGIFRCYRVSFGSIGQTFWFGVEGSRPLVKFKAGNAEAELVKMWGPENIIETSLAFFRDAGWKFKELQMGPGPEGIGVIREDVPPGQPYVGLNVSAKKGYTAAAEIPRALREALPNIGDSPCRPETVQNRVIGGQRAVSCVSMGGKRYHVRILSQSVLIGLSGCSSYSGDLAICRWKVDRILATAKRIP